MSVIVSDSLGSRACRNLVIAAAVGFILPSINNLGIFATFTASAVAAWIGYGSVTSMLDTLTYFDFKALDACSLSCSTEDACALGSTSAFRLRPITKRNIEPP